MPMDVLHGEFGEGSTDGHGWGGQTLRWGWMGMRIGFGVGGRRHAGGV